MLRVCCFLLVAATTVPATAQRGPGGPTNDVQDCPIEYLGASGNMHQYRVRSCADPSYVVYAVSPRLVICPVNCIGMTCPNPIFGNGNPAALSSNTDNKRADEPATEPLLTLGPENLPWQDWDEFIAYANESKRACTLSLGIEGIRRLPNSNLVPAKSVKPQFDELVATVPKLMNDVEAAKTRKEQDKMLREFNSKLNRIFMVSIPAIDGYANPLRLCDFPTQADLPESVEPVAPTAESNKATYTRDPKDVTQEDLGVVKVEDGDQVFYFQLTATNVKSSNGMFPTANLRLGQQVTAKESVTKSGRFVGANLWVHKLEVDGKLYLVTTKDQRKSSVKG